MSDDDLPAPRNTHFDRDKARRAARHPDRPGEHCKAEPARYRPVIDHGKCEGKSDCIAVCPYDVFEVRKIEDADWRPLSVMQKIKVFAHRKQTAYAVRADACKACGLCVVACPEKAVTLVPARKPL
ncbi:MAG: 4Fe-4S dicluster domain-containing protein [Deltaproteobacteria bacterium]|nr:4Fe-4S dicluster domain-containing protein [Deltaproteobacteria bacterium]